MIVQIAAPCCLPFGLVCWGSGASARLAWLGITLQHPPVAIDARPAPALRVTGARADLGHAQAERVLQRLALPAADLEVEFAIPKFVGLASEAMLGLAVARALAALADHPAAENTRALADAVELGRRDALAVCGFDGGGLLLVDARPVPSAWPVPQRRHALAHPDHEAWAWVLHFPPTPDGISPTLETDRADQLLAAAPHLSGETGRLLDDELWPAMLRDDMAAFGQALLAIQALNRSALDQAGAPDDVAAATQGVLDLLRDNGALAYGESATGLARFGLIRGASPSIELRKVLSAHVGYEGGTVMAAICDVSGARHRLDPEEEGNNRYE